MLVAVAVPAAPITILSVILFIAAFAANPYVALVLKGMQAGVAAVILDGGGGPAGVVKTKSPIHLLVMAAFCGPPLSGVNVIYIILAAALLGVVLACPARKKGGKSNDLRTAFWSFLQIGLLPFSPSGRLCRHALVQAQTVQDPRLADHERVLPTWLTHRQK